MSYSNATGTLDMDPCDDAVNGFAGEYNLVSQYYDNQPQTGMGGSYAMVSQRFAKGTASGYPDPAANLKRLQRGPYQARNVAPAPAAPAAPAQPYIRIGVPSFGTGGELDDRRPAAKAMAYRR